MRIERKGGKEVGMELRSLMVHTLHPNARRNPKCKSHNPDALITKLLVVWQGGGTTIHSDNVFPTGGFDRLLTPNLGAWSRFALD